jgi:hypothetical protein
MTVMEPAISLSQRGNSQDSHPPTQLPNTHKQPPSQPPSQPQQHAHTGSNSDYSQNPAISVPMRATPPHVLQDKPKAPSHRTRSRSYHSVPSHAFQTAETGRCCELCSLMLLGPYPSDPRTRYMVYVARCTISVPRHLDRMLRTVVLGYRRLRFGL